MSLVATSRIKPLDSLPPLPYVTHEILMAVNDPDASFKAVGAALAREPGLTARLVAMANSAFFMGQRPVYSPEDAVVRLGLNRVRVLAASLLLAEQFDSSRCPPFRAERYWFTAVGTAFCAARIARLARLGEVADAAYLAGLLHNIGLLLLVYVFPKEMADVLIAHEQTPSLSLSALTLEALGTDHREAGRLLLAEWGLPEPIVEVAGYAGGHRAGGPHATLIALIEFSARWTASGFAEPPPRVPYQIPHPAQWLEAAANACRRECEQLQVLAQLLASA